MELIDIYDENNNYLGYSKERKDVHEQNLWHRHVSAWIMNYNGEILLQQRSFNKNKNPGKWSKTGGHVDSGEVPEEAIKREVYEEIGLEIDDNEIKNIDIYKSLDGIENYFAYNYIFFTNKKEEDFTLQKEEVNQVKYYSIEQIEELRRDNNQNYTFCKWKEEDFNKQIKLLKKYRYMIKNNITIKYVNYTNNDFINLCNLLEEEHVKIIKEQRSKGANCLNNLDKFKVVLLAYVNDLCVGSIAIKELDNIIEVGRLYVLSEYRNKGIATILFDEVEEYATKYGFNSIILDTYNRFESAVKLYKKLGFYEIENYIENSPYSICMKKEISK